MAAPNSKATFKEYIKRKLGAPVLEINIDDDQFDDRIDEALQYFHNYHYDGTMKTYLKHQMTSVKKVAMKTNETETESAAGTHAYADEEFAMQQNYIVLPESVTAVMNIFPFNDKSALNMWDIRYQLRLNDLYSMNATNLLHYESVQQQIQTMNHILIGRTPINYNQHQNRLYLHMDSNMINDNEWLIIECYRKIDPNNFTDVYNDMWLKKYATALCKYQWGENLSKFSGIALPGGVTLDGQQMKQEAQEEITRLEEESRLNHDMLPMDMIG
jgi:hypothetical protein|tara:strand:+ start:7201 stop:8016 length:816 start_codon:yes stop_codon:yes gene_type:complete